MLGLHGATLHASRQRVHWFLNSLATKSERVNLQSVQLYSLLATITLANSLSVIDTASKYRVTKH